MNEAKQTTTNPEPKKTYTRRLKVLVAFDELECADDTNGMPGEEMVFERTCTVDDMDTVGVCQEAQEMFDCLLVRLERNLVHLDGGAR